VNNLIPLLFILWLMVVVGFTCHLIVLAWLHRDRIMLVPMGARPYLLVLSLLRLAEAVVVIATLGAVVTNWPIAFVEAQNAQDGVPSP